MGFLGDTAVKNPSATSGDLGSIPEAARSPGGGNDGTTNTFFLKNVEPTNNGFFPALHLGKENGGKSIRSNARRVALTVSKHSLHRHKIPRNSPEGPRSTRHQAKHFTCNFSLKNKITSRSDKRQHSQSHREIPS